MNWKILCYHTVDPAQAGTFAAQLRWYQKNGYRCRPFSQALTDLTRTEGRCASVTFDDGDWSACAVAQKVLADEGVCAILYLTTDYILKGKTYQAKNVRPSATWDQLGRWLQAGHEIGSHTHSHADLTQCSPMQRAEELECTQEIIRRELGITPVHFAYPWGRYSPEVLQWFRKQTHWQSAVAVGGRGNNAQADRFALGRYALTADWNLPELRLTVLPGVGRFFYRRYRFLMGKAGGK